MHGFEMRRFMPMQLDPDLPWDQVILSVVIPCYNEVATVERLLRKVREVPLPLEVIVVDDGSTDGTRDVLPRLETSGLIDQLIFHEANAGKGAALRTGFARATGDVVVVRQLLFSIADISSKLIYGIILSRYVLRRSALEGYVPAAEALETSPLGSSVASSRGD